MAYQNAFLLREALSDTGRIPEHGSFCSSPDIITHASVQNPESEFTNNYSSDPNEKIDTASRTNLIYTRIKSLQDSRGLRKGYIRLYRASGSLFMNTDKWAKNKLITPKNEEHVFVSAQNYGEISVGNDVFVVDGTKSNFCIVGIVNDTEQETLPNVFKSYSEFIVWVHTQRAVGVRNFSLMSSGVSNNFEELYNLSNPENNSRLVTLTVTASNLPNGTIFGLINESLNMDKSMVFDPNNVNTHQVADSTFLPAHYDGYAKIHAKVPTGSSWPPNATINTSLLAAVEEREEMMKFAMPAHEVLRDLSSFNVHKSTGKLVRLGSCSAMYL